MGLFDEVFADAKCPFCGAAHNWRIQHKMGDVWQHEQRIGDSIAYSEDWDDRPNGLVRTPGITGPCPSCSHNFIYAEVHVRDGMIVGVVLRKEELDIDSGDWERLE